MLVFLGATALLNTQNIKNQIREEMTAGTKITVQLLTTFLSSAQFSSPVEDRQRVLINFLKDLGRVRAHEIIMINSLRDIIYTSPPSKYKAGRYAPNWFTKLVEPKIYTTTIPAQGLKVKIIPNPSRAILDAWDDVKELLLLAIVFFILINLIVFWIIGRALSPIKSLIQGLNLMTKGNLQTRLPDYSVAEFHAVTDGFNQMANALEMGTLENKRLALSIKQSSDALLITETNGLISFWNPAAEKLFGYPFKNQNIRIICPKELLQEMNDDFKKILELKPIEAYETTRQTSLKKIIEVSEQVTPIIEPSTNEILGALFVIRDLTEKRSAEKAKKELEKNRELTTIVQKKLEEERKALAMELHDELGQYVTAIKSIAQSIANRSKNKDEKTFSSSTAIVSAAAQIYDAVHNIIQRLRPITLERFGLIETLKDTIDNWQKIHEQIHFNFESEKISLAKEVEISLFRISQECINNSIKHSKAKKINIKLTQKNKNMETLLIIQDDGVGISDDKLNSPNRFGIKGIRERVKNLGGSLKINTGKNKGTKIIASIPMSSTETKK